MFQLQTTIRDSRLVTNRLDEWLSIIKARQRRIRAAWTEEETISSAIKDTTDTPRGLPRMNIIPNRKGRKCRSRARSWESVPRRDELDVHHLYLKPYRAHRHSQLFQAETQASRMSLDACSRDWEVV